MSIKTSPARSSIRPNVSVTTNTNGLNSSANNTDKQLMLVGMAQGGEPGAVYEITTMEQAKNIFRGGDLLDAIEVALTPNSTQHSGTILAERVGHATQAQYKNKGLVLTSKIYSVDANNIQTSLQKNTLNDTYTLTVSFVEDSHYKTYTNLGKIMGISYTGTQNYADVTIVSDVATGSDTDKHTNQATKLILRTGADKDSAALVKEFPLGIGIYKKVNKLIQDINAVSGFSASYFYTGNKNIDTKYLDAIDQLEISKDATAPTYLTSLGGDIVNTLANEDDSAVSAVYNQADGEPDTYDTTNLAGGSSSDISPSSWVDYFQNMSTVPGFYLVPLTSDITIQKEATAFCADRVKEGDPKSVVVGGGINDSINATIQRSNLLRTTEARVGVIANSGTRLMRNGVVQDLPAYLIAAQVGGLLTGLPIGESITFKQLDLLDVDQKFTKEQLDLLDMSGCISIEYVRERNSQVFRITDDVTTARANSISTDPVETELGTGEAADFLSTNLRTELEETYIGTSTTLSSAADIKAAIISFLQQEQNNGIVEDYRESDIHVSVIEETADIVINCVLARTLKTITVSLNFVDEQLIA